VLAKQLKRINGQGNVEGSIVLLVVEHFGTVFLRTSLMELKHMLVTMFSSVISSIYT